jgi:hypothetical protein
MRPASHWPYAGSGVLFCGFPSLMKAVLLLVLILLLVAVSAGLMLISRSPELAWTSTPSVLGTETPVSVQVTNPHGVRRFTASLDQEGRRWQVHETSAPSRRLLFWRHHEEPRAVAFSAGAKSAEGLKDGTAKLIVEAQSNDFLGRTSTLEQEVVITTRPLTVSADGLQHYINQGGSELVLFTVSGLLDRGRRARRQLYVPQLSRARAGRAGGDADRSGSRFFAFPWDVPAEHCSRGLCAQSHRCRGDRHLYFTSVSQKVPLAPAALHRCVRRQNRGAEIDPRNGSDAIYCSASSGSTVSCDKLTIRRWRILALESAEGLLWSESLRAAL